MTHARRPSTCVGRWMPCAPPLPPRSGRRYRCGPQQGKGDLRRGCRDQSSHRRNWSDTLARDFPAQGWRARQCADALQSRLAATVDWGTATSPIYNAVEAGIDVHVFVDESRPTRQPCGQRDATEPTGQARSRLHGVEGPRPLLHFPHQDIQSMGAVQAKHR